MDSVQADCEIGVTIRGMSLSLKDRNNLFLERIVTRGEKLIANDSRKYSEQ